MSQEARLTRKAQQDFIVIVIMIKVMMMMMIIIIIIMINIMIIIIIILIIIMIIIIIIAIESPNQKKTGPDALRTSFDIHRKYIQMFKYHQTNLVMLDFTKQSGTLSNLPPKTESFRNI